MAQPYALYNLKHSLPNTDTSAAFVGDSPVSQLTKTGNAAGAKREPCRSSPAPAAPMIPECPSIVDCSCSALTPRVVCTLFPKLPSLVPLFLAVRPSQNKFPFPSCLATLTVSNTDCSTLISSISRPTFSVPLSSQPPTSHNQAQTIRPGPCRSYKSVYIAILLYCYITLQYCNTAILQYYNTAILQHCNISTLQHWSLLHINTQARSIQISDSSFSLSPPLLNETTNKSFSLLSQVLLQKQVQIQ
ncbi:hypothetical protein TBLA_0A00420 [Henningerozyma blattae CBS 6284]|uniref:Uncharacterized protein n=1 Tax=Henningerozyma blattae (strain ATCC 34711 / CBS 6284 / DSM 70876 / NBRC 10599 / NRRL Y-10934 / UCD 77-7) TaxID=1071380 RepID=I2GUP0_HENB6|nr:hypothetical protein TBLA_0A00420 [Tetrapisispora blattae CBS 6284]CCH57842.1 hypothetical protein TBLA_0A00420 [Tetrapisispora blattae CBS 6284]